MLLDAGGHGEDVGVEDDVLGREVQLVHQDAIGALADLDLTLEAVGLALLVEGHHDHRGAVATAQARVLAEFVLALLHGDGVDDGLALHALQAGLDDLPLGGVDHHRNLGDIGLGGDQVEEAHHGRLAVEHAFVHVHVDDLRTFLHLGAAHVQGLFVFLVEDQALELRRAGHVGALAHRLRTASPW